MKILVLGSGAREHALAWRLARDGHDVLAAPGNPGAARVATLVPGVDPLDTFAVVEAAQANGVDLVVVGPEAPLVAGVVDALEAADIPAFGPTAAAARLEGSKVFAKEFMARHGIATAPFTVCDDEAAARRAIESHLGAEGRVVLKADGLAAGKGVLVTGDREEAHGFARDCLSGARFGDAGRRLVVEAFLAGEEVSLFFLSDGSRLRRFVPARDYKRVADGDRGPNTGGMGAVAPAELTAALAGAIEQTIARPTIDGLAGEGTPFRGLLYVGLMVGADGPHVLEYNVRFGDPETQVLLPLVAGDFGALLLECARGALETPLEFERGATVGVVLAAPGYPDPPRTGGVIEGLDTWPAAEAEDREHLWCFHAGTRRRDDGALVAAGGRVVTVVARAADRDLARTRAYEGLDRLALEGGQARRDIARSRTPEDAAWRS